MKLILASTSKYRKELFNKKAIPILTAFPQVNEEEVKFDLLAQNASPIEIALNLARAKALSVQTTYPEDVIIGSDQICALDQEILNKPGSHEKNIEHIKYLSGKSHQLITAVCICSSEQALSFYNVTNMFMKELSIEEINEYVSLDQAYDCAGGYKYERNGHKLFEKIETDDMEAIQGLPMRQTLQVLNENFGFNF